MDRIAELCQTHDQEELISRLGEWSNDPEKDNPLSYIESVGTLRRVARAIGVEELAWIVSSSSVCIRFVIESPYVPDDLDPRGLFRLGRKAFGRRIGALRKMARQRAEGSAKATPSY